MKINFTTEFLCEQQALLKRKLKERKLQIDDSRLLRASLTPYFISKEKFDILSKQCELVVSAIEKFLRVYVNSIEVQRLFPELEKLRDLTLIQPKFQQWISMARFDLIETPEGNFKLLETNCACPVFVLPSVFKKIYEEDLDLLPKYLGKFKTVELPLDDPSFYPKYLVELSQVAIQNDKPNIALLTSTYNTISSDMNLLMEAAQNRGYNCQRAHVQNLELRNGKIHSGDFPIDVAYQKFLLQVDDHSQQMIPCIYQNSESEVKDYLIGIREQNFVCTNSFVSFLVAENKRIVSLLKRPAFSEHFTADENEAIQEFTPETYSFDYTNREDFNKYLPEFVNNKADYVIKSVGNTRGRAVWIGQDSSEEKWNALVLRVRNEPFIIQKYITQSLNPVYDASDSPQLINMHSTISVHIVKGKACGIICRSSKEKISNESQTGVLRPAFVVEQGANVSLRSS